LAYIENENIIAGNSLALSSGHKAKQGAYAARKKYPKIPTPNSLLVSDHGN